MAGADGERHHTRYFPGETDAQNDFLAAADGQSVSRGDDTAELHPEHERDPADALRPGPTWPDDDVAESAQEAARVPSDPAQFGPVNEGHA